MTQKTKKQMDYALSTQTIENLFPSKRALRLCELSAFCGQLFFEILLAFGAEFFPEQSLAIRNVPEQDLQESQHALFQNNRADEVRTAHIFPFLAGCGAPAPV